MKELNDHRPSWQDTYFSIAETVAKRSKDPNTKVGAVIVKEGCVVGVGYNGKPREFTGEINWQTSEKYKYVIHAEMNAVTNANRVGVSVRGADIYVTLSPCASCMNLLIQHGIKNIYFKNKYKDFEDSKWIANNSKINLIEVK